MLSELQQKKQDRDARLAHERELVVERIKKENRTLRTLAKANFSKCALDDFRYTKSGAVSAAGGRRAKGVTGAATDWPNASMVRMTVSFQQPVRRGRRVRGAGEIGDGVSLAHSRRSLARVFPSAGGRRGGRHMCQ